jgi:hypothetical protein
MTTSKQIKLPDEVQEGIGFWSATTGAGVE